jgi:phosphoglycolate phosphatase
MLRALGATGEPEPYEPHLRAFRRAYDAVAADHSPPYPGVDALLRRWAARVPLALCTNKPEAPARAILARHGWTRLFSAVIGGDSCPTQKPEPGMVRACLEAMDVSAGQSRYVGDSPTDASAAIAAGVPLALMTWGYSPHDVSTLGAQAVLDSAAGLDRWLAQ